MKVPKLKNKRENEEVEFLQREFFVPLRLAESIEGIESKNESKIVYIIVINLAVWLFTFVIGYELISRLFNTPFWLNLLVFFILFVMTTYFLLNKLVYNGTEELRERNKQGKENKNLNLAQIWNITPNSIEEKSTSKGTVVESSYDGKPSLFFRIDRGCFLKDNSNGQEDFYRTLREIDDFLSTKKVVRTSIDMKFNPINDNIWSKKDAMLQRGAAKVGSELTSILADINSGVRHLAFKESKVRTTYYIITPAEYDEDELEQLTSNLVNFGNRSNGTLKVNPVQTKSELITLFKDYYGLKDLNIKEINNITEEECDIKSNYTLYIVTNDGKINIRELEPIELPDYFETVTKKVREPKNVYEEVDIYLLENTNDIFKTKIV